MSNLILIDTSAWIEFLRPKGKKEVADAVEDSLNNGQSAWNEMIQLELFNGVFSKQEYKMLNQLKSVLPLLSIDQETWQIAIEYAAKMQSVGKTVPSTDLLIYSSSRRHQSQLIHSDKHFDWLSDL